MWTFLYQMASPKLFYFRTQKWLKPLGYSALLSLLIGIFWGLVFAPADYQQGNAFRIIYIHVPSAFLSLSLYAWMGFLAILLLVWRIKMAGLILGVVAQVGASMALLALITGSIWGKPMWGTWWVWDARLTSELVLLFLYLAIIAVKNTFQNRESGDKVAAILTLVGLVDLPIIHYSVYWWNTLHQGSSLSVFAKPTIAGPMLYPLLFTLVGFLLYCSWIILHNTQHELLLREKRQRWIHHLMVQRKC